MRNKFYLLVLTVIVSVFAMLGCGGGGGGSNPAAITDLSGETASLSGSVILDGQPQANIAVNLYKSDKALNAGIMNIAPVRAAIAANTVSDGVYATSTNDKGEYHFASVPLGEYTLIAGTDENQFAQTGIVLNARASTTTVNAQLTPTGKITGKVRVTKDSVTQNVGGAFVYISGTSYVALTNSLGEFELNRVPSNPSPAAAYEIQVMSPMGTSVNSSVRVAPGEVTGLGNLDLTFNPQQTATVNGSISSTGVAAAAFTNKLVIISGPDGNIMGTQTNASGQFSFLVKFIGTYQVRVVPEFPYNYQPANYAVSVTAMNTSFSVPAFTASTMDEKESSKVSGTVTWNQPTFPNYAFQSGEVVIQNTAGTPFFFSTRPVQTDGLYAFDHVPPGTYTVRLDAARNGFSAGPLTINTVAGTDYTTTNLNAAYIAPYVSAFSFAGSVMSLSGANFVMSPNQTTARANETPLTPAGTWTPTSISFEIGNLPPGQYNLRLSNSTTHAQSQIFNFTRNLDAPTGLTVAEISDRHARIKWVNAPFAQVAEVEYPGGTWNQVQGNSFEIANLTPSTSYTINVRNRFNSFVSVGAATTFVTQAPGLSAIASITFNPAIPTNFQIFGFEVENDRVFVGMRLGNNATLRAYNALNGNQFGSDYTFTIQSSAGMFYDSPAMAVNSQGVCILSEDGSNDPNIRFINRDLQAGSVIVKSLRTHPDFNYGAAFMTAKVRSLKDKFFLMVGRSPSTLNFSEITNSLVFTSNQFSTDTAMTISYSSIEAAYQKENDTIYLAHLLFIPSNPTSLLVKSFPSANLTSAPSTAAQIDSFNTADKLIQLAVVKNRIHLLRETTTPVRILDILDSGSSYVIRNESNLSYLGVDKQNRIWFDRAPEDLPRYFLLQSPEYSIEKAIRNFSPSNLAANMKLDNANGMMNFLTEREDGNIILLRYNSNF